MRYRRIAAATLNQIPFDWKHNQGNIMEALLAAYNAGASYCVLPELCVTGYECEDFFTAVHLHKTAMETAIRIAKAAPAGLIFNLGLPVSYEGRLYNCSALVVNQQIVGFTAKRFLAGDSNYYEQRQFKAWPLGKVGTIWVDGRAVPIGDISYLIGNRYDGFDVLAFEICEEAWLGRRVGGILKDEGAEIFFNPSASHYSRGKYETRHRLLVDGSRAGDSVVAFANMHGCNGRLIFDGGATICERGTVRAQGKRFSQAAYTIVWADCDLDLVTASRCKTASNVPSSEAVALERVVVAEYNWYEHGSSDFYPTRQPSFAAEDWELGAHFDEEETCRANALAHRDWLYKNQLKGVALPFSGGRDSALAACYVKIMVELGVAELGLDGFKNYFVPYFPGIDGCFYPSDLVEKLLLTFYEEADNVCLPGEAEGKRISSHDTEKAAEGVAKALGAAYYKFPIGAIVSFVLTVIFTVIGKRLGRRLNWKDDGIPLQNLQARTRAFIAWFIANIENRLLITTSNRTEGATGYWTAGGDGEGGLAPNAGLSKEFICQILQVLQFHGLQGVDPIGELALVTGLDASAELLPTDMGAPQKDEDELGPFPVLNAIENATLENQRSPKEGLIELTMKTTQYTLGQLANWVERWHKLWFRNQWKREQATAGLHTEAHNVDPRAGFRAPIISGGFKQELAEMWDYVRRQEESSEDKSADEQAA